MRKPRYFERFSFQSEFHSATLPSSFFDEWTNPKHLLSWSSFASSCIKHLVEHKDAPIWLRDRYKSSSQVGKRIAALITNAPPEYAQANIDRIKEDRSKKIKELFAHRFLIPKLLGDATYSDSISHRLFATHPEKLLFIDDIKFKDSTYNTSKEYYDNYAANTINPDKLCSFSEDELLFCKIALNKYQYQIIKEISAFAENKTLGLLSVNKQVRLFAEEYFKLRGI